MNICYILVKLVDYFVSFEIVTVAKSHKMNRRLSIIIILCKLNLITKASLDAQLFNWFRGKEILKGLALVQSAAT